MDRLSPERRSWLMSKVASKNTTAEIRVRRAAHALGLRFRLHRRELPGTPDLIFPRYQIALFVHGCFWHRHTGCRKATTPKTHVKFWHEKFDRNIKRDHANMLRLKQLGWHPKIIWECETQNPEFLCKTLSNMFHIRKNAQPNKSTK